jgi:hypothetical protein
MTYLNIPNSFVVGVVTGGEGGTYRRSGRTLLLPALPRPSPMPPAPMRRIRVASEGLGKKFGEK